MPLGIINHLESVLWSDITTCTASNGGICSQRGIYETESWPMGGTPIDNEGTLIDNGKGSPPITCNQSKREHKKSFSSP